VRRESGGVPALTSVEPDALVTGLR
jgi:hypothetical protein